MRQSSEAFAKVMLENEDNGNSQNFVEKMAEFEKSMTERIDKMQNDLLSKMAEVQTTKTEVEEVTPEDAEVTEDAENTENEEKEGE